ncbi:hypothetical protein BC628DRAFT_1420125 [Trametes gibbosa]|nr:hypothetical protein BC628DRAFT_1420125 [Trametes gibbosa]
MPRHELMAYDYSRMSSELWGFVVKNLPRADQRSCLSVSRPFRDLARIRLFPQLTIHIGMWKAEKDEGFFDDDTALMERRKVANVEILQCIARDANFAKIVDFRLLDFGDLPQFKTLQTLSLAGEPRQFPLYMRYEEVDSRITACVKKAPDTLLRLSVWCDSVWAAPPSVFFGLHELSLQDPQSLDKFSSVLMQCSQLRALNILVRDAACGPELTKAFSAVPSALPYLVSFKLICYGCVSIVDPNHVITFLRDRKDIRRLDLALNKPFADVEAYARFLGVFTGLPQLEVVGLELEGQEFTREHMQLLDERLPLGLSALLLTW